MKRTFPIFKAEEERRIAGVVYAPEEVDAHGDFARSETILKAAELFMMEFGSINLMHSVPVEKRDVSITQSFVAPVDFEQGGQKIKRGSWVLVAKVHNDEIWNSIKSGELTGWSLEGFAEFDESPNARKSATGVTITYDDGSQTELPLGVADAG